MRPPAGGREAPQWTPRTGSRWHSGLAEYALNHINTLYRIPDNVSYEEAVVVMTSGSPLFGIQNAGVYVAGETVAVLGPGPIGLMAVQLVKALGAARVILTGTRESRLALGRQLGADVVIDSRSADPVREVLAVTQGKGADVVIDCAGGNETFDQAIRTPRTGSRWHSSHKPLPPERSEPVRLIAMLAGDNDAVKNEGSQVEDRCNCSQLSSSFDPRLIAVSEGGVWILG